MDKWLISVTAGLIQRHGIRKAKKLGYKVLAIDQDPRAIGFKFSDIKIVSRLDEFKEIINYVLKGGKRLRPIIIYEITQKMNFNNNTKFNNDLLGVILELLHSASLIIDDLPCMDNDSERRGQPSAHVKYGKTGAQLLSYSLLFLGKPICG